MKTFDGAKSLCTCGHSGDGKGSVHAGPIGHGRCEVPNCNCPRFTWRSWTPDYAAALLRAKGGRQ